MNIKSKVYSYHPNNSKGIGGIESLIRRFHRILNTERTSFIELYNSICSEECFDIGPNREQIQLEGVENSVLDKFRRKLALYRFTNNISQSTIIMYSPRALLALSKKTLTNNRLILVQANSIDMVYRPIDKLIMSWKGKYVDDYTVYTSLDKEQLNMINPRSIGQTHMLPRACKLVTSKVTSEISFELVTIARIEEKQKNFSAMISIMNRLGDKYTLDIYGDGEPEEIENLVELIKNEKNIRYRGIAKDVEKTLKSYSLFLITSRYEGFGQTLIEARSQGLPIVGYNTYPALSWIVEDGLNGKVVEFGNEQAFCDAVLDILSSYDRYKYYSDSSLKKARETEGLLIDQNWIELLQNRRYQ
ncbi:glycosyltransferase [Vibrio crassostreae]|uniref:glycosyltransferase n=1 Tax=Vibrio crassostreae TaxID=246167 RepID=UPI000F47EA00|nr:glycosyltransferase [Vibrio crassostreae]ROO48930.1 glycosyltransferase involved in cell wall biosynthesis [Vibrio crassostreae]ROO49194.1 glycosyltransferase involved in cell wall biosynthesis [Vibrio crassostreae]ROO66452.1 glycosyltransferase involved in cell wall biosynthesis [Vibrio crassostreae]ROO68296.1 glycosyltransferase involved in cell wall biosynthesis [Vibrio crassostreae]ROR62408.1 glycosyltransferase involved in cell wall biosynthesis [Vibrio crassostreae]